MRLTNYHRESFIRAVVNDLPPIEDSPEYKEVEEEVEQYVVNKLPECLRRPYLDKNMREYFSSNFGFSANQSFHVELNHLTWEDRHKLLQFFGRKPVSIEVGPGSQLDIAILKFIGKLKDLSALRIKLRNAIFSCTTLKQAKEHLPGSLHKYLPANIDVSARNADRSLPVVSNVLADLKAFGWPRETST